MRDHTHVLARADEFLRVIALVRAQRDADRVVVRRLASGIDHDLGCFPLSMTIGGGDHGVGNQAMAVVREGMAHVAHLTGRLALAVQPRVGVGARSVGVVAAALALEAGAAARGGAGVTTIAILVIVTAAILAHEAAVTGPGLDEGAIDTEVLTREPPLVIRRLHDVVEQFDDRVVRNEPLAVLGETLGTQTASSMASPMNQRYNRLYWVCSMSWRSERTLKKICTSIARSNFSGAMLGRPPLMSASYMPANRPPILSSASLTMARIGRSG